MCVRMCGVCVHNCSGCCILSIYVYIIHMYYIIHAYAYNKGPAITQSFDPKCADRKWKINYVLDNGQFPFTDA